MLALLRTDDEDSHRANPLAASPSNNPMTPISIHNERAQRHGIAARGLHDTGMQIHHFRGDGPQHGLITDMRHGHMASIRHGLAGDSYQHSLTADMRHGFMADMQHSLTAGEGPRPSNTASGLGLRTSSISGFHGDQSGTPPDRHTFGLGSRVNSYASLRQYDIIQRSSPIPQPSSPLIPSSPSDGQPFSGTAVPVRAKKASLTDELRLSLVKLCLEHQSEHVFGRMRAFWNKMSLLLEQENGVKLRDTRSTMNDLVAARKLEVEKHRKESGTVQNDTELTQTLDRWIEHEDLEDQRRADAKKAPSALAKEAREASIHRMNMMRTWSKKRRGSRSSDGGGSDLELEQEEDLDDEEVAIRMRAKRRKGTVRDMQDGKSKGPDVNVQAIVGSMATLGERMMQAVAMGNAVQQPDLRAEWQGEIQELRREVLSQMDTVRAENATGQAEIMALLQEMRRDRV